MQEKPPALFATGVAASLLDLDEPLAKTGGRGRVHRGGGGSNAAAQADGGSNAAAQADGGEDDEDGQEEAGTDLAEAEDKAMAAKRAFLEQCHLEQCGRGEHEHLARLV